MFIPKSSSSLTLKKGTSVSVEPGNFTFDVAPSVAATVLSGSVAGVEFLNSTSRVDIKVSLI
ncbi:hypothetical protein D3C87_1541770 [compost metagenome]